MTVLASYWLRQFQLLLCNRLTQFNETGLETRSQRALPSLCFGLIGNPRWPPWPLIGWGIFYFSVIVDLNENWQEARSQRPLSSLCFGGRLEIQDGGPGLWLVEAFSVSSLQPLNRMQRNWTGSKISTSYTKFVFFRPIGNQRWPSWSLIGWYILDFSSATTERNATILDRKQGLKVLYQVCVFRTDRKSKMATMASDWPRHFRLLLCNCWTEYNETLKETSSLRLYQVCVFRAERQTRMAALASDCLRHFKNFFSEPLNRI